MMKAIVYKSTGSWYIVKDDEGKQYNARIPGKFKMDGLSSTNPVAVGDSVTIVLENEAENVAIITEIDDRKNYVTRISPANKHQHHIIASNIDQSLLFATLKHPVTSQGFIDRFLITCEAYQVSAIIVFNKTDLYKKKEEEKLSEWKKMYAGIGYKVFSISTKTGDGIAEINKLLGNKITLISGHSGVGKSSFINLLFPDMHLKTKEVSEWSGKGIHTTTFAEMFDLPEGGTIIDTPGIRELGLVDISIQELCHFFPEMKVLLTNCRFNNCIHINEPGCAVKYAVEKGTIAVSRYLSYCNILDKINGENR